MASTQCKYALLRHRQWCQVEACCNHEKKDEESQMEKHLEAWKTGLERLPDDILINIFSRLPLISIVRARYTCKCWHKIMTDPEFANIHLTRAIRSPGHLYLFSADSDIYYVEKTTITIASEALKSFQDLGNTHSISGHKSSGGLMACYAIKEFCYVICNPFTGERVKVKNYPAYSSSLPWGFGYSSSTKEYKIVRFGMKTLLNNRIIQSEIFTLGSESWRQIPHVPLPPIGQQVDCDGALFWLIHTKLNTGGLETVMSFDVGSEKFQAWRGPPLEVIPEPELKLSSLVKFGDTVSFVMNIEPNFNIWILRDKVNDIWVNEYKIVPGSPFRSLKLNFVGKWMNHFLFAGEDRTRKSISASYDADNEEFEMIQMPFWNYYEKRWGVNIAHRINRRRGLSCYISHVGSLISPRIVSNGKRPDKVSSSLEIDS